MQCDDDDDVDDCDDNDDELNWLSQLCFEQFWFYIWHNDDVLVVCIVFCFVFDSDACDVILKFIECWIWNDRPYFNSCSDVCSCY